MDTVLAQWKSRGLLPACRVPDNVVLIVLKLHLVNALIYRGKGRLCNGNTLTAADSPLVGAFAVRE